VTVVQRGKLVLLSVSQTRVTNIYLDNLSTTVVQNNTQCATSYTQLSMVSSSSTARVWRRVLTRLLKASLNNDVDEVTYTNSDMCSTQPKALVLSDINASREPSAVAPSSVLVVLRSVLGFKIIKQIHTAP